MTTSDSLEWMHDLALHGVRHRHVTLRGSRVHLAEAGDENAPVLLLLHGFPQHWYAWRGILTEMARDFRVVAMDLPGFGWSAPSAHGYSTFERSRAVVALLDELGVQDADIVGHDWGGWLAFRVALDHPQRVRRLVSICQTHPWPLQRWLVPNLWRMWVTALFEIPVLGAVVQRRRGLMRWFLRRDALDRAVWTDELVDAYAVRCARPDSARAGQRQHLSFVMRDIARLVTRRDHRRSFETPTLLLGADHDRYIPPRLMAVPSARADVLRVATVPGGHFVLDENPDAISAAVRAHLGSP